MTLRHTISKERFLRLWPYLAVTIGWLVLIFPSTLIGYWFFLDDPVNLKGSMEVLHGWWWLFPIEGSGRFLPAVWLYRGVVWALAGDNPPGFYLAQSLLILASGWVVFAIGAFLSRSRLGGALAAILFFSGTPMPEVAYTLGKSEALQFLGLVLAVDFCLRYSVSTSKKSYLLLIGFAFAEVLAVWSKETSAPLLAGFLAVFLALLVITPKFHGTAISDPLRRRWARMGWLAIVGFSTLLLARLPYYLYPPKSAEYVTVDPSLRLVGQNTLFYLKQVPDLFITGMVVSALLFVLWIRFHRLDAPSLHALSFATAFLLLGWAAVIGMLFWKMALIYYLYAASGVFSCLVGAGIVRIYRERSGRAIRAVLIVVTVLVLGYGFAHGYFVASVQSAVTEAYGEAIATYLRTAEPGQCLYIEFWPKDSEAVIQTNVLLNLIRGRRDLVAVPMAEVNGGTMPAPVIQTIGPADAVISSRSPWPRTGDFVLMTGSRALAHWAVRCVSPSSSECFTGLPRYGYKLQEVFAARREKRVLYPELGSKRPRWSSIWYEYRLSRILGSGPPGNLSLQAQPDTEPQGASSAKENQVAGPLRPPDVRFLRHSGPPGSMNRVLEVLVDPNRPVFQLEGQQFENAGFCRLRVSWRGVTLAEFASHPVGRFSYRISLAPLLKDYSGTRVSLAFETTRPLEMSIDSKDIKRAVWRVEELKLVQP